MRSIGLMALAIAVSVATPMLHAQVLTDQQQTEATLGLAATGWTLHGQFGTNREGVAEYLQSARYMNRMLQENKNATETDLRRAVTAARASRYDPAQMFIEGKKFLDALDRGASAVGAVGLIVALDPRLSVALKVPKAMSIAIDATVLRPNRRLPHSLAESNAYAATAKRSGFANSDLLLSEVNAATNSMFKRVLDEVASKTLKTPRSEQAKNLPPALEQLKEPTGVTKAQVAQAVRKMLHDELQDRSAPKLAPPVPVEATQPQSKAEQARPSPATAVPETFYDAGDLAITVLIMSGNPRAAADASRFVQAVGLTEKAIASTHPIGQLSLSLQALSMLASSGAGSAESMMLAEIAALRAQLQALAEQVEKHFQRTDFLIESLARTVSAGLKELGQGQATALAQIDNLQSSMDELMERTVVGGYTAQLDRIATTQIVTELSKIGCDTTSTTLAGRISYEQFERCRRTLSSIAISWAKGDTERLENFFATLGTPWQYTLALTGGYRWERDYALVLAPQLGGRRNSGTASLADVFAISSKYAEYVSVAARSAVQNSKSQDRQRIKDEISKAIDSDFNLFRDVIAASTRLFDLPYARADAFGHFLAQCDIAAVTGDPTRRTPDSLAWSSASSDNFTKACEIDWKSGDNISAAERVAPVGHKSGKDVLRSVSVANFARAAEGAWSSPLLSLWREYERHATLTAQALHALQREFQSIPTAVGSDIVDPAGLYGKVNPWGALDQFSHEEVPDLTNPATNNLSPPTVDWPVLRLPSAMWHAVPRMTWTTSALGMPTKIRFVYEPPSWYEVYDIMGRPVQDGALISGSLAARLRLTISVEVATNGSDFRKVAKLEYFSGHRHREGTKGTAEASVLADSWSRGYGGFIVSENAVLDEPILCAIRAITECMNRLGVWHAPWAAQQPGTIFSADGEGLLILGKTIANELSNRRTIFNNLAYLAAARAIGASRAPQRLVDIENRLKSLAAYKQAIQNWHAVWWLMSETLRLSVPSEAVGEDSELLLGIQGASPLAVLKRKLQDLENDHSAAQERLLSKTALSKEPFGIGDKPRDDFEHTTLSFDQPREHVLLLGGSRQLLDRVARASKAKAKPPSFLETISAYNEALRAETKLATERK